MRGPEGGEGDGRRESDAAGAGEEPTLHATPPPLLLSTHHVLADDVLPKCLSESSDADMCVSWRPSVSIAE